MELQVETLDGRHALNTLFTHRVAVKGHERQKDFVQLREWCWEMFGAGVERTLVWHVREDDRTLRYRWCWHIDPANESNLYLYFREETASAFFIRWCN